MPVSLGEDPEKISEMLSRPLPPPAAVLSTAPELPLPEPPLPEPRELPFPERTSFVIGAGRRRCVVGEQLRLGAESPRPFGPDQAVILTCRIIPAFELIVFFNAGRDASAADCVT